MKHPQGYWTLELCKNIALKYMTIRDIYKNDILCARAISRNKWQKYCYSHFENYKPNHPHGYWIIEKCKEEALKYSSYKELCNRNSHCAAVIRSNGWEKECLGHFKIKHKTGFWTLEHCIEEALKYSKLKDLYAVNKHCAQVIRKNNWQDECYSHFDDWKKQMPRGYWTFERCKDYCKKFGKNEYHIFCKSNSRVREVIEKNNWQAECYKHFDIQYKHKMPSLLECEEIVLQFDSRTQFKNSKKYSWLYYQLHAKGLIDSLCLHMDKMHNLNERCIYICTFSDNHVYIGLTCNANRRWNEHTKSVDSPVYRYMQTSGLVPSFKILQDYMSASLARQVERNTIKQYKEEGWLMLNTALGGQLGGSKKKTYTKEFCLGKANSYSTLSEFRSLSSSVYDYARKSDFWDEIISIFVNKGTLKKALPHRWKDEEIWEAIEKCRTRQEFRVQYPKQYNYCVLHNRIEEFCSSLPKKIPNEEIEKAVAQCFSRKDFKVKYKKLYEYCQRNKLIDFFCQHLKPHKGKRQSGI